MPPEIMPLEIPARASSAESSGINRLSASSTPGTSVSISSRVAFSAPATAPAAVSALML